MGSNNGVLHFRPIRPSGIVGVKTHLRRSLEDSTGAQPSLYSAGALPDSFSLSELLQCWRTVRPLQPSGPLQPSVIRAGVRTPQAANQTPPDCFSLPDPFRQRDSINRSDSNNRPDIPGLHQSSGLIRTPSVVRTHPGSISRPDLSGSHQQPSPIGNRTSADISEQIGKSR